MSTVRHTDGGRARHGITRHVIATDTGPREYRLYVPRSYDGRTPVALVVDLHASGITPETQLLVDRMDVAAERRGFALALPAAVAPFPRGGTTWSVPPESSGPDDRGFVLGVIDDAARRLRIDLRRVHAVGYSGGARLASQLACDYPERIATIAAVAGLRHPGRPCRGRRPVPVLAFHSVDDPVNHYRYRPGVSPAYWRYGMDEALLRWARSNGCRGPWREHPVSATVTRVAFPGCRPGSEVVLYRGSGDGHTWPGSPFPFPDYVGPVNRELDATAIVADFFARHSLREADAP